MLSPSKDQVLKQLDAHNVFLNSELDEVVYMFQPCGFVSSKFPKHVCKLNKMLYDLNQAPHAWFHRLSNASLQWGFYSSKVDYLMFVYVNGHDIIVIHNNSSQIQ